MELVQEFCHTLSLQLRVFEDGRTSPNFCILLLNLWRPTSSNDGSEDALKGKWYKVAIGKEIFQKVVGLTNLGTLMCTVLYIKCETTYRRGSPHVQHNDC